MLKPYGPQLSRRLLLADLRVFVAQSPERASQIAYLPMGKAVAPDVQRPMLSLFTIKDDYEQIPGA